MTDQTAVPDYEFQQENLHLQTPAHFKALGDATRQKILGLLGERAATTSQLADILQQPKGTVGHHLRVLQRAGLIRVVRTHQVRALTEKYYGLVARHWRAAGVESDVDLTAVMLQQVLSERDPDDCTTTFRLVHSRISAENAGRFIDRLNALAEEFRASAQPGQRVYGFLSGVYLADWPDPPGEEAASDGGTDHPD
jgi:DNA-binding transcriptional ArsR family regulator